jgi:hypothetical protein
MWHEWEIRQYVVLAEKKQNGTVISMPMATMEDNIQMGLKTIHGKNSCLKIAPG